MPKLIDRPEGAGVNNLDMEAGDHCSPLRLSIEAMALADVIRAPDWILDLGWQVAAGLLSADDAVGMVVERCRREFPECFLDGHGE
jgi:hypothetical protein